MSRRRIPLGIALLATATSVATVLVSQPAGAGSADSGSDFAGTPAAAVAASPAALSALQRDLGLSEEAAISRLAAESRAGDVDRRIRERLGESLGGTWYDARGEKLVVAITDPADAAAVRAAGATPQRVTHSEKVLRTAVRRLDGAGERAPDEVSGWRTDPVGNTVVVRYRSASDKAARAFVQATGVRTDLVRYERVREAPRPLIDVVGGNRYWTSKYGCSVGFTVNGGFVSAGHCGEVGETTTQPSGRFKGSSFPGDDMAYVQVNAGNTLVPAVNRYRNNERVNVAGSREALVGASICRSGGTTGWHCGTIKSWDSSVDYGEYGQVTELLETNVCAESGDSGGSAIAGQQAQGVTSGGSGDCKQGGTTWFQPVNEILQTYKVTLATRSGPSSRQ
ncbi:S1 family peptidase [Streptomyces zagrosensis]|uniref:Streptogrisin C n=1 Tax=Streptomyces zagrosensis TaxID=1042984 RepID=A0A7W9QIK3_9ACTN|nr:S1 family peptidase [Streptomyces zagrosensis]MBB5939867.1 streptogrisin C [Streptomyces zagrosensis]